ncbi:hypothetical protein E4T56_gene18754 [Termitomyces sp. T112]|nr:hypothetical protein E4T56_gene18754 [Termitomyces sp. T112]
MTQSCVRAINEQINNIEEAFTRFRDLCANFEEESKRSVTELELENTKLSKTAKWLAQQKQELQRQVENHKPELEEAIDARETALRKLRNAYGVVRDLINEIERLQVANDLQSTFLTKAEESEETRQVIREAMAQSSSPGSSDSDRTPRQSSSPLRRGMPQRRAPKSRDPYGHHDCPAEERFKSSSHLPSPEASGNEESVSDSKQSSRSSFANVDDDGRWSIHYGSKPPGVCNMSFGPVAHKRLLHYSVITNIEQLRQLEKAGDLCLRLHSINDLVFLNDPIFLEERAEGIKKTYILDWGIAEDNASLTEYIRSRGGMVLHTFVFPEKKKNWYYVGGFTWQVANNLHDIWRSLGKTSRKKVLSKLCERSSDYDEKDIATKLDDGRLSQICFEISSDGLWEKSQEFALSMGYQRRRNNES